MERHEYKFARETRRAQALGTKDIHTSKSLLTVILILIICMVYFELTWVNLDASELYSNCGTF
jgi:hypothetical protein